MNKIMNYTTAANIVMNALKKSVSGHFNPYHWTFTTKGGVETVEFIASKVESKYTYTKVKSFLGIKYGMESFTLSSSDDELDMVLWHQLGDVLNNVTVRFGSN